MEAQRRIVIEGVKSSRLRNTDASQLRSAANFAARSRDPAFALQLLGRAVQMEQEREAEDQKKKTAASVKNTPGAVTAVVKAAPQKPPLPRSNSPPRSSAKGKSALFNATSMSSSLGSLSGQPMQAAATKHEEHDAQKSLPNTPAAPTKKAMVRWRAEEDGLTDRSSSSEPSLKFEADGTFTNGDLRLFYGGLGALIGNPKTASLFKEMEKEHCHSNDSWLWFACHGPSGHKDITSRTHEWTTSRIEWFFVTKPGHEGWDEALMPAPTGQRTTIEPGQTVDGLDSWWPICGKPPESVPERWPLTKSPNLAAGVTGEERVTDHYFRTPETIEDIKRRKIDELKYEAEEHAAYLRAKLQEATDEELAAARLYTSPMYIKVRAAISVDGTLLCRLSSSPSNPHALSTPSGLMHCAVCNCLTRTCCRCRGSKLQRPPFKMGAAVCAEQLYYYFACRQ